MGKKKKKTEILKKLYIKYFFDMDTMMFVLTH